MKSLKPATLVMITVLLPTLIFSQTSSADQKKAGETENQNEISDIWLNTVWKSIDEVTATEKSFEVEKVTTVAGVRGAEAEDEATKHLYYRGSMRIPTREELQETIITLESIIERTQDDDTRVPEMIYYVSQCYLQLGNKNKASELNEELVNKYPDSKWANMDKSGPVAE